jgi:hypothetical protein
MADPNRDAREAYALRRLHELGYRSALRDAPASVTLDDLAKRLRLDPVDCRRAPDRLNDRGEIDLRVVGGVRLQLHLRRR